MKKKKKKPIKIRKTWGELDPTTKVIPDKKNDYNRAKSKREWQVELDDAWAEEDLEF